MDHIGNRTERRILRSWKEIASYTGCGVRTVQRYEQALGLPVRRADARSHTSVIAFADELDAWLRQAYALGHRGSENDGVCPFAPERE